MEDYKELFEILDSQSKILVGTLLKRLEILEQNNALNPTLYRAIIKEHIYESLRATKTLISVGRVVFKIKPQVREN